MNGDLQWRSITASAPAKVILHGEHSVVYGKLALAASIDLRTKVIFKLGNQKESVRVNLLDFSERPVEFGLDMLRSLPYDASSASEIDENLRNTLENIICNNVNTEEFSKHKEGLLALVYILVAFMQEAGLELRPLEIIVSSEIPMGAGLGSSAAFSVSMAAALVQLKNCLHKGQEKRPLEEDRVSICHWAFKSEKIIHGNPSGLDNSICTFGGIMSYITGQPLQPLASNSGSLRVLLINSCVSRNTKALVSQVRANRVNLMPKVAASILEAMDRVAKDAAETLGRLLNNNNNNSKNGSNHLIEDDQQLYRKLEELIDTNQGLLSSLGVSHPSLEKIISITAKQQIHAKLTGAGGGGFAFALLTPWHSQRQIETVKRDLESEGFVCWETKLAVDGVQFSLE